MADRDKVAYHPASTGDHQTTVQIDNSRRPTTAGPDSVGGDTTPLSAPLSAPINNGPIVLFERASPAWWDPKFDSDILERKYRQMSFPERRQQFRYAVIYAGILAAVWAVYFGTLRNHMWQHHLAACSVTIVITAALFKFTYYAAYQRLQTATGIAFTGATLATLLPFFGVLGFRDPLILASVSAFTVTVELLLVLYSLVPLRLYTCVLFGVVYSTCFETLNAVTRWGSIQPSEIIARALMHLALHVMGIHIYIMAQVRGRSTFLKVIRAKHYSVYQIRLAI